MNITDIMLLRHRRYGRRRLPETPMGWLWFGAAILIFIVGASVSKKAEGEKAKKAVDAIFLIVAFLFIIMSAVADSNAD